MDKEIFLKVFKNKIIRKNIYLFNLKCETYIFSTAKDQKASLINITDKDNLTVETYDCQHQSFLYTYDSVVTAGEYIYIFGGENEQKYCRFSMKSKTFDITGELGDLKGGWGISCCYDGKDHIYIIGGIIDSKRDNRIDRYHIHENRFEKFYTIENKINFYVDILSFFYKDLLYVLPDQDSEMIMVFNPFDKSLEYIPFTMACEEILTACTDGNGNIYINDKNFGFAKFNVESKAFESIDIIDISSYYSSHYHKASENESYIYYICGKIANGDKNFRYSLENRKMEEISLSDDSLAREGCGSSIVKYYYRG